MIGAESAVMVDCKARSRARPGAICAAHIADCTHTVSRVLFDAPFNEQEFRSQFAEPIEKGQDKHASHKEIAK